MIEKNHATAKEALAWLERRGTKKQIGELGRYGITATRPFGVSMGDIKKYAGEIGEGPHACTGALGKRALRSEVARSFRR